MEFNLEKAGGRVFIAGTKPVWKEGESVMQVTDKNFIMSSDFCKTLNFENKSTCTFFFKKEGLFIMNTTGNTGLDKVKVTENRISNLLVSHH